MTIYSGSRRPLVGLAVAGLLALAVPILGTGAAQAAPALLPYQDASLPFSVRAADLVSRMTLEEKAVQFNSTLFYFGGYMASDGVFVGGAPAIERLGVPTYNYWSEALHGVAREGAATEFPTGLGIASTWDRDMVKAMTAAISDEARAFTNDCLLNPQYALTDQCKGLTYWSPTINLNRDPRWGRADESYGEDPYLAGELAGMFAQGLQGGDTSNPDSIGGTAASYLKAVSTPKHYLANNSEVNRHNGTSMLTDRSLHEYYTAQFGRAVEYGAKSFMTSYNATNVIPQYTSDYAAPTFYTANSVDQYGGLTGATTVGTPQSANEYTVDTLMRRMYGFDGFVTSDCGATEDVYQVWPNGHSWAPPELGRQVTEAEGSAWSLKAGTDVDCFGNDYPAHQTAAMEQGLSPEQIWDVSLTRAFTVRFQTGEFDVDVPWKNADYTTANQIGTAQHLAQAHQMSLEAPVLLKNDGDVLPLSVNGGQTVVVGHYADLPVHGGYSPGATSVPTLSAWSQIGAYVESQGGQAQLIGQPISGALGANPSVSSLDFRTAAGANPADSRLVVPSTAFTADGTQNDGAGYFFNHDFSGNLTFAVNPNKLGGHFKAVGVAVPADAAVLTLGLSGADFVDPTVAAGDPCYQTTAGCPTVGTFDVTIAGVTKTYTVNIAESYNFWTTAMATAYAPLTIDFATDFPGVAGTQATIDFTFKVNGSESGVALDLSAADEQAIQSAENVIVYLGTRESDSNEEQDRPFIDLPRLQDELAARVAALNPNTVVYIQAVGQVNLTKFKEAAKAIIWTTYNGQYQGQAAAELLFNQTVTLENGAKVSANPSGKLTYTYYSDVEQQLGSTAAGASADYRISMADGSPCGRTYWYYQVNCGAPDYPFGYGLSYSDFAYSNLALSASAASPNDTVTATVDVKNNGTYAGREVVQLYAAAPAPDGSNRPYKQLKGFAKTAVIQPGQSVTVSIDLPVGDLWFWDSAAQKRTWDQGDWTIQVGPDSVTGQTAKLTVSGSIDLGVDVITAIPDGTQLNLKTPDSVINAHLSVTAHDQSFYDLAAISVTYTSADPAVATVNAVGTVSAVGVGATLITATATADGESKSTTFPVVVHDGHPAVGAVMDLEHSLKQPLGSVSDTTLYGTLVNFGDPQPVITAGRANVQVQLQANVVPAVAGVTYAYLIAPMDLNEIGATVTQGGLLEASRAGNVEVTVIATVGDVKVSHSTLIHVLAAEPPADPPGADPSSGSSGDPSVAPATTPPAGKDTISTTGAQMSSITLVAALACALVGWGCLMVSRSRPRVGRARR
jgi:beta-glucosidase-like glycosyl hydrolase